MSDISAQTSTHSAFLPGGWLRSKTFDLNLIATVTVVALLFGLSALAVPNLFGVILFLDLWLLGYHHVVSTFTRLVFDRASFQEHRFLVIQLPLIVIAVTFLVVWQIGLWVLPTVYLYWQWFHYTRQSYGIERMFRRSAPEGTIVSDRASKLALYFVPLFGIAYRSYQANPRFLGMEVAYIPMPVPVLAIIGAIAAGAFGYWVYTLYSAARQGCLSTPHTMYLCSHHLIFVTGYLLIENITTGWLVLNVWHNLQYIMFVWWFNNKRFKDQVDPQAKLLSTISQTKSIATYIAICFIISSVVYLGLDYGYKLLPTEKAISATLITTMILNFHHYVVDGIIWKRRKQKPPVVASSSS